jgi:hypothetical protein
MTTEQIVLGVLSALAVNEFCDLSPWVAGRLVRWSARLRYTDPVRADTRAEEFTALIGDRPGKLFKLLTALGFVAVAIAIFAQHSMKDIRRGLAGTAERITALSSQEALAISGPPGSGKTRVIVDIIRRAVGCGNRILFVTPTHATLEEVLLRIGEHEGLAPLRFPFQPEEVGEDVRRLLLHNDAPEGWHKQREAILLCCTASGLASGYVRKLQYDVVVVEDANLVLDKESLPGEIKTSRWILAGDQYQPWPRARRRRLLRIELHKRGKIPDFRRFYGREGKQP